MMQGSKMINGRNRSLVVDSLYGKPARGHSLIEMLVVLIIVGVLVAIIVPAVQRSRESARQAQCISHQADLAKAVHMFVAADSRGHFPGYRYQATDGGDAIGWAAQLFKYLGRNDLDPTDAKFINLLVCPSDAGPRTDPRMNYVANGGQPGIDSPADGVFFDHAKPVLERVYISKDDFHDGLTNTILLAENLDATYWNDTEEASQCILWPLTPGNEVNRGTGSRPSSHHPGGFVAAFADGSVKFMAEQELNDDPDVHSDGSVYVAYLTPGGSLVPGSIDPGEIYNPCLPPEVGSPVEAAMDWIVRHQLSDGSWSFHHTDVGGGCDCPHDAQAGAANIAATGLALLPLLGSGSTQSSGPYRDAVCKGVEYLMARQAADGSLWETYGFGTGGTYSHLWAHMALAEAMLLGQDATSNGCAESGTPCEINSSDLQDAVERATAYTIAAMSPDGSWRYTANVGAGDMSHFSWGVAALATSKKAGVNVPQSAFDNMNAFLAGPTSGLPVTDQGITIYSQYRYLLGDTYLDYGQLNRRNTTYGLLSHAFMGVSASHQAIRDGANMFTLPIGSPSEPGLAGTAEPRHPFYINLKVTQLKYLVGGQEWNTWNDAIQDLYISMQEPASAGHRAGSIYGLNAEAASDANRGGRLYTTVMASLCLETVFTGLRLGEP